MMYSKKQKKRKMIICLSYIEKKEELNRSTNNVAIEIYTIC